MNVIIGTVYKTQHKHYLRLEAVRGILYHFILVTKANVPIPEKRNRQGHVITRSNVCYTEEVLLSFKKTKI